VSEGTDLKLFERVSDCCLSPSEIVFSYIKARKDHDDICFVLDQQPELIYCVIQPVQRLDY